MNEVKKFQTEIGGKTVDITLGKYAFQSNGSCIVTCDETVVMVNVTMSKAPRPGQDFFPLGVDFEEKLYAVAESLVDSSAVKVELVTKVFLLAVLSTDL